MSESTHSATMTVSLPPKVRGQLQRYARLRGQTTNEAAQQSILGALQYERRRRVLQQFRQGKLTIRWVAERLGLSYLETDQLLAEEGMLALGN